MSDETLSAEVEDAIRGIAAWIREARNTVVLTGAGISTDSGIPDYRGPQGVWTLNPEAQRQSTLENYMTKREVRVERWKAQLNGGRWKGAEPNAGHHALAELERKGKLQMLVTQNVDGLHAKAGMSRERLIEIHGTTREFRCMNCTDRGPIERVLARVEAGDEDPACRSCGGILKTATISFGQNLVMDDLERAQIAAATADVFLAIGTSLTVYPAASLPEGALRTGGKLAILNLQETPYDPYAHVVIRAGISQVLPRIVELV